MSDIDDVKAVLNDWMESLDSGDLERMVKTCDPEVVVCNERKPTTVGVQAITRSDGPGQIQRADHGIFVGRILVPGAAAPGPAVAVAPALIQ